MVWKNFKQNKKLKKKFNSPIRGNVQFNYGDAKAKKAYLPKDGILRPSDNRKKLTFIEKTAIKRVKRGRNNKKPKIGDEVLNSKPKIKLGNVYQNILGKTMQLIFGKNNPEARIYVQNSFVQKTKKKSVMFEKSPLAFERFFNIKTILFRSFWLDKFVNTLITEGRKMLVWRVVYSVFLSMKLVFMRSPSILIFEILENFKTPLKALPPKNKTRKVIVRVHLVSWWKQYMQVLRWIRQSTRTTHRMKGSWEKRVLSELTLLVRNDRVTTISKKIELNNQLIAFGRVSIHFRWHRRFNKRKIKLA